MIETYSFLDDELALQEIRKHKWIESEKKGEEIGFATAAVDWMFKYGQSWKQFRLDLQNAPNRFQERRGYRRFRVSLPLKILVDYKYLVSSTQDFSLIGCACSLPEFIKEQTKIDVSIQLKARGTSKRPVIFHFSSRVCRITKPPVNSVNICYQAFLPFSEAFRDYLRSSANFHEDTSLQENRPRR